MTNTKQNLITEIIHNNDEILHEFFSGKASGEFYEGSCWKLYIDVEELDIYGWVTLDCNQRPHNPVLVEIYRVHGYSDLSESDLYDPDNGDDINDFGWNDFIEEIKYKLLQIMIIEN
jgi:hypothetical protein